ncbi:class I SAM-dependent methyltransferase [Candidatus Omnitrophota bacterium]
MGHNLIESYWKETRYRFPEDPVVKEFVSSKIKILERFISLQGKSILDVGCGNGTFMYYFSRMTNSRVVGIDISDAMLSNNRSDDLVKASADSLPFKDASFDIVFGANLLHHTENPELILREMKRVCREHIVLIEPNRLNPIMFLFSLFNKAERGGLRSCKKSIRHLLAGACLDPVCMTRQGVITQNNTPQSLVPFLRLFEREFFCGAYIIAISKKS